MSASSSPRLPFTTGQLATLIVSGWIFWFVGAIICRVVGDMGWFDGPARLIVYAALIPGTLPVVLLVRRLAKLDGQHVALGIAIVTAAAIMLDGIALAWFPALYGPGVTQTAASGAVILWGGFVAIALACWFNRVPPQ
ncbi:MAG: hypothetical protein HC788_11750 [Sphingopyxis sp.]|nr:hypothetical protein [Sphingopyxis sp.]